MYMHKYALYIKYINWQLNLSINISGFYKIESPYYSVSQNDSFSMLIQGEVIDSY